MLLHVHNVSNPQLLPIICQVMELLVPLVQLQTVSNGMLRVPNVLNVIQDTILVLINKLVIKPITE